MAANFRVILFFVALSPLFFACGDSGNSSLTPLIPENPTGDYGPGPTQWVLGGGNYYLNGHKIFEVLGNPDGICLDLVKANANPVEIIKAIQTDRLAIFLAPIAFFPEHCEGNEGEIWVKPSALYRITVKLTPPEVSLAEFSTKDPTIPAFESEQHEAAALQVQETVF